MRVRWMAAAVLALAATAARQDKPKPAGPPKPGIAWIHAWDDAVEEAKIRNVPIHVAFHMDG